MTAELGIIISARHNAQAAFKQTEGLIAGLQKQAQTASDSMRRMGESLTGIGTKLSLGVTTPILGFAGAALKAAANNEQLEVAFTTMLGSAEKAQSLMKDISDFSASTPFQFDEVVNAGRSLLAFGVNAEDVTDTLRRLGDVSSGVGAPLNEIATIYGKAKVSGRLFAADINELTGRGVPVIRELAKVLGVTESEVKKMVEAGKVGFPELEKVFQNLTNEGGQFAGLMEAQSQTLGGLFSTLKDNVALSLTAIGTQLIETFDLKTKLAGAIEFTEGLKNSIISFAENNPAMFKLAAGIALAAAAVGPLVIGLGFFVSAMGAVLPIITGVAAAIGGGLVVALGALLSPLGLVAAAIAAAFYFDVGGIRSRASEVVGAITDTFGSLKNYFRLIAEDGDYLNDFLVDMPALIQPAVQAIGQIYANMDAIPTIAKDAADALSWIWQGKADNIDWWGDITNGLVEMGLVSQTTGDKMAEWLYNAGVAAGAAIQYFRDWAAYIYGLIPPWAVVQTQLAAVWSWLQVSIPAALGALSGLWASGVDLAVSLYGTLSGYLAAVWSWLQVSIPAALGALSGLWASGVDLAVSLYGTLSGYLAAVWSWLQVSIPAALGALSGLWAASTAGATEAYAAVSTALAAVWAWMGVFIPAAIETVKQAFAALPEVFAGVSENFAAFQEAVQPIIDLLANIFGPTIDRLKESFDKMFEGFSEMGPTFTQLGEALTGLMEALRPVAVFIGVVLVVAVNFALNMISALVANLAPVVQVTIDEITAIINTLSTIITDVVTAITAIINGDWTTAWTAAQSIFSTFASFVWTTIANLGLVLSLVGTAIKDTLVSTLEDLGFKDAAEKVDAFLKKLGEIVTMVTVTLISGVQTLVDNWPALWEQAKASAVGPLNNILDPLKSIYEYANTKLAEGLKVLLSFFEGFSLPNPFSAIVGAMERIVALKDSVANALSNLPGLSGILGGQATGGPVRASGFYNVGETGRETVFLPRGAYVANQYQMQTAGIGGGNGVTVNLYATINSSLDLEEVAYKVARVIRSNSR
jgi:tape measure domain-containing protein